MQPPSESLTDLIQRARNGESGALQAVFDTTYVELHRMASNRLRPTRRDVLLDTTALVHECFMRFANAQRLRIEDRVHFFRYAGQVMRSVIVDLARAALAERRGGEARAVTLNTSIAESTSRAEDEIVRVHEALEELAQFDPRLVHVVELRYFAGLTEVEVAEALGVTDRTVRRDWEKARLLLAKALAP